MYKFNIKKAVKLKEGKDVTIISNGDTLVEVLDCAKILSDKGINAEVIHLPVVKPIDKETVLESAKKTKRVVTVENHSVIGGLGSAVSEVLSENQPTLLKRIGINDEFGQSGKAKELLEFYGLTAGKLSETITEFIK